MVADALHRWVIKGESCSIGQTLLSPYCLFPYPVLLSLDPALSLLLATQYLGVPSKAKYSALDFFPQADGALFILKHNL